MTFRVRYLTCLPPTPCHFLQPRLSWRKIRSLCLSPCGVLHAGVTLSDTYSSDGDTALARQLCEAALEKDPVCTWAARRLASKLLVSLRVGVFLRQLFSFVTCHLIPVHCVCGVCPLNSFVVLNVNDVVFSVKRSVCIWNKTVP